MKEEEDADIIRPPPRLMGRRMSNENKTEKNEDSRFSINMGSDTLTLGDRNDSKKEDNSRGARGLTLTLDEPMKKKEETSPFFSFSKEKDQPSRSIGK